MMKMKAAVTRERGKPFVIEEVDVIAPGPRDIIVRTGAASYCITDNLNNAGRMGKQDNTVFGHSAVGEVVEVGSQVTTVSVGDHVACGGTPECGVCANCARQRPDQCKEIARFDLPLGKLADGVDALTCPVGGYGELMRIPEYWAFPIESSLPDEQLCMLGCGITSAIGAIFNVAKVTPGSSVAVLGCGHLGLWMIQGARVAGAEQVIAVEPIAARREMARELGATDLVDPGEGDPVAQVLELTGGAGVEFAFEAAGAVQAMTQAMAMTLNTGVTVISGVDEEKAVTAQVTFPAIEFVRGRDVLNNQNGRCSYRRDLPIYIRMIEEGKLRADPILSGAYPLEQINEVSRLAEAREILTAAIVPSLAG
jgi:S-(hydroxymethyl)glutathione dehydrogenase/alcohol dehydrogenase